MKIRQFFSFISLLVIGGTAQAGLISSFDALVKIELEAQTNKAFEQQVQLSQPYAQTQTFALAQDIRVSAQAQADVQLNPALLLLDTRIQVQSPQTKNLAKSGFEGLAEATAGFTLRYTPEVDKQSVIDTNLPLDLFVEQAAGAAVHPSLLDDGRFMLQNQYQVSITDGQSLNYLLPGENTFLLNPEVDYQLSASTFLFAALPLEVVEPNPVSLLIVTLGGLLFFRTGFKMKL